MNKDTLKFLFSVIIVYAVILLLTRGFLSSDSTTTVSLTAIPLIVIAVMIIRNLTTRSVQPPNTRSVLKRTEKMGNRLEFLSHQIDITAKASAAYFDDIIRVRLRELVITKTSLETGIDTERIRQYLSDPKQGPEFLHDNNLYRLLYSAAPKVGETRITMIRELVRLIENWKA